MIENTKFQSLAIILTNNKVETAIAQMASKDKDIPIIINPLISFVAYYKAPHKCTHN